MKTTKYMAVLMIALCTSSAYSQNLFNSQFHHTPMLTNPAQVAVGDRAFAALNYRKQYLSSGETYSLAYTQPLMKASGLKMGGMGISVFNEKSGEGGIYKSTGVMAGYAYTVNLSKKHSISGGLQAGYLNYRVDVGSMTTSSQYLNGGYDPGATINENFEETGKGHFSISSGFVWNMIDDNEVSKAHFGVAAYNINRPKSQFFATDYQFPLNLVVHGGVTAYEKSKFKIVPTARYIYQGNNSMLTLGTLVYYGLDNLDDDSYLSLGGWYNSANAAVLSLGAGHKNFMIEMGYDMSAGSKFNGERVNSAMEITMVWRGKRREKSEMPTTYVAPTPVEK